MKIICDQMLGSLATWLRILGFDTLYVPPDTTDDELISLAGKEHRLIITRDKMFSQKAKKQKISVILLHTTNLVEQLRHVLGHLSFNKKQILTRCTLCNSLLQSIDKSLIICKIPSTIFQKHETFWCCPTCSKIYWMGTHYDNMLRKIETLAKKED
jgi:uncharacterized protein